MAKEVASKNYSMAEVRLNRYSALYKRIKGFNWGENPHKLNRVEVTSYKQAKEVILQLDFKEYLIDSLGKIFDFTQNEENECDFLFLYPILVSECSQIKFKKLEKKLGIHLIEVFNPADNHLLNINRYYFLESKGYSRVHYNRTENGIYSLNFNISNYEIDQNSGDSHIKYINLNIIDMIMLIDNLKYKEAINKLCNYFDIIIMDETKRKYLNNIEILKELESQYPFLSKYMKADKCNYLICFHEYAIEMSKGNMKNEHRFCFVHRNAKQTLKDTEFSEWSHTSHSRALRAFIKLGLLYDAGKSDYKSKLEYESPNFYSIPVYTDQIMKNAEQLAKEYKKNKISFTKLSKCVNRAS